MENNTISHIAFADETKHNQGRFRGISLLSIKETDVESARDKARFLLKDSGVKELKWERLRTAKARFAAKKIIDWIIPLAAQNQLRIDVLTWDINDSRHRIFGRDDLANLGRMYFHIFKNVMQDRWPNGSKWLLHPDEQTAIDWNKIQDCLSMKGTRVTIEKNLFANGLKMEVIEEFGIKQIIPKKSHEEPLIQIADLFAGIGSYSRECYDYYDQWKSNNTLEPTLFPEIKNTFPKLGPSHTERCYVLDNLNIKCKKAKLRVSLKTNKGLKTLNPNSAVNFWWYKPQREEDKAPVRKKLVL